MEHLVPYINHIIIAIGFGIGVIIALMFLKVTNANNELKRELNDMKRELEELKRKG